MNVWINACMDGGAGAGERADQKKHRADVSQLGRSVLASSWQKMMRA